MKIYEKQFLHSDAVRKVCIERNWYTKGTNEEYGHMFDMVRALRDRFIITADDLYPIAADICKHSDIEYDVTGVMYALAQKIVRTYGFDGPEVEGV